MSYKTDKVVSTVKKNIWVYIILWLIIAIVLVAPVVYTYVNTNVNGSIQATSFIDELVPAILKFTTITEMGQEEYSNTFLKVFGIYTLWYAVTIGMSISKILPKSEYDKKEHGSSDWCENGEQYRILSNKNGILLAKENYLPLDKRGNLNVLIVGRIWYW